MTISTELNNQHSITGLAILVQFLYSYYILASRVSSTANSVFNLLIFSLMDSRYFVEHASSDNQCNPTQPLRSKHLTGSSNVWRSLWQQLWKQTINRLFKMINSSIFRCLQILECHLLLDLPPNCSFAWIQLFNSQISERRFRGFWGKCVCKNRIFGWSVE